MNKIVNSKPALNIVDFFALYVLIWSVTPALSSGTIYRVLLMGCAFLWILNKINYIFKKKNTIILMGLLIISCFILFFISSGVNRAVAWTINMSIYCIVALIGFYYIDKQPQKIIAILNIMLVLTIVIAILSIKAVIADPTALRLATYEWNQKTVSYGAYDYVYMCVQALPFLIIGYKSRINGQRNYLWNILCLIALIVYGMLIVLSGFTLANIISLCAIIVLFVFENLSFKKTLILIVVGLCLLLSYKEIISIILNFLIKITDNFPLYSTKIKQLANQIIYGDGIGSTYSDRVSLYNISWSSVVKYPILGSILISGESVSGGHSTLVDVLAYGGLGYAFIYYWLMIVTPVKRIKRLCVKKKSKVLYIALFLTVAIMTGIFDTITYAYAWIWFLLIPYLSMQCSYEFRKREVKKTA